MCVCVCVRARKCVCMRFHGIRLGEMWKTRSPPVSMETPSFERRAAGPLCIERMQNALFPITERSHDHAALWDTQLMIWSEWDRKKYQTLSSSPNNSFNSLSHTNECQAMLTWLAWIQLSTHLLFISRAKVLDNNSIKCTSKGQTFCFVHYAPQSFWEDVTAISCT